MQIEVKRMTVEDELEALVTLINEAAWDGANDIDSYTLDALRDYLAADDRVFVAAFIKDETMELAGMASARIELKPYSHMKWLYVDEVDTCVKHRQKGVGTALMKKLLEIARASGCEEVWLGTEQDNEPAKALYQSLSPDSVTAVVGYTFHIDPSPTSKPGSRDPFR